VAVRYWIETLGCPKNQVDSDKLAGSLDSQGYRPARDVTAADVVVVNTCAFIEAAREESIETILAVASAKRPGARLVVTGCLAARAGAQLADALPEVDLVLDVGVPVPLGPRPRARRGVERAGFDLLELPRPRPRAPWAYVKVAEGCDRRCGFCAIPSFRGPQRSRPPEAILAEVEQLGVREVVLVAQDLASYGRDRGAAGALLPLVAEVARRVERVRLLYLYPASVSDELIDAVVATGVPYFDLSLQHASRRLLRRMRRYGSAERFLERIAAIRRAAPDAALRSSFIVGYPGETEEDHDVLLEFLAAAQLDWAGFFRFSPEEGTLAATLPDQVPEDVALERLRECGELQDAITTERRQRLVGSTCEVLVDAPGIGRSHREAPEIDGVVRLPPRLRRGSLHEVAIAAAEGPDLIATGARPRGRGDEWR